MPFYKGFSANSPHLADRHEPQALHSRDRTKQTEETMADPFTRDHDAEELNIAGEFLTNWLPFLTRDLCDGCSQTLADRIKSLRPDRPPVESPDRSEQIEPSGSAVDSTQNPNHPEESPRWSEHIEPSGWGTDPEPDADRSPDPSSGSPKVRMSWADMAQEEDELVEEEERARERSESEEPREGGKKKVELPRAQREWIRFKNVGRKKDFICLERVKGKIVNILDGLELHTGVFSVVEQKRIVDFVYELQEKGRRGELRERTYSEPQKWMRGKGRITIQFGCCYNYALDKDGNPPGILRNIAPDPIPRLFKGIIKRLVRWHVLPTSCIPDSCIVNIYEPGDCIPPHIDSHDFVRPFSTVSFLSECNILFGTNLIPEGPGEFSGSTAIPLPVGSVLVLNGNGADVAKHCVPAVPTKRISITFRKMDESLWPIGFGPEPDLQNIQPLPDDTVVTEHHQGRSSNRQPGSESRSFNKGNKYRGRSAGSPYQMHDPETTPTIRTRQVIDARSATISDNSSGRSRGSSGRSFESRSRRLRDDADDPVQRSPHQEWQDEGSGHWEESNGSRSGRKVRVDQKRLIISRNIDGDEEVSSRSFDQARNSRGILPPPNTGRRRVRVAVSDDQ